MVIPLSGLALSCLVFALSCLVVPYLALPYLPFPILPNDRHACKCAHTQSLLLRTHKAFVRSPTLACTLLTPSLVAESTPHSRTVHSRPCRYHNALVTCHYLPGASPSCGRRPSLKKVPRQARHTPLGSISEIPPCCMFFLFVLILSTRQ